MASMTAGRVPATRDGGRPHTARTKDVPQLTDAVKGVALTIRVDVFNQTDEGCRIVVMRCRAPIDAHDVAVDYGFARVQVPLPPGYPALRQ